MQRGVKGKHHNICNGLVGDVQLRFTHRGGEGSLLTTSRIELSSSVCSPHGVFQLEVEFEGSLLTTSNVKLRPKPIDKLV